MNSMYKQIAMIWHKKPEEFVKAIRMRKIDWRKGRTIERLEHPTRIDRARRLGYKAKQGFIVVRVKVRRGGQQKRHLIAGRRPKRKGINKLTVNKSIQRIAEERAAKKYSTLEVLNSYYVGEDGKSKFYEIIMVDTHHPVISSDPKYRWLLDDANKGRVFRGLTSAGKKGRGLRWKGKGAERMRPSRKANIRRERRIQYKVVP